MSLIPAFEIGVWNAWIFMIWLVIFTFVLRLVSKEVYQRAGQPSDMKPSYTYKIVSYISMPLWILATLYSVFLPFQLGTIWFSVGLAIFLLGLVILLIATINFATTSFDEPITKGIYRFSRHPMYLSTFLIYFGVSIASASWVFLLLAIIELILTHYAKPHEEHYCLEKYGDAYRKYMNKTPKLIGIPKS